MNQNRSSSASSSPVNLQDNLQGTTILPASSLISTEGLEQGRVEEVAGTIIRDGGFEQALQVLRLDEAVLTLDGANRTEFSRRSGLLYAWVQIHRKEHVQVRTWLLLAKITLDADKFTCLRRVDAATFVAGADASGGLITFDRGTENFFLFRDDNDLPRSIDAQRSVVDALSAADGETLDRLADDCRDLGLGWWRKVPACGSIFVYPTTTLDQFLQTVRQEGRVGSGSTRFILRDKFKAFPPVPLDIFKGELPLDEALVRLDQALAQRTLVPDPPPEPPKPAPAGGVITPLRRLPDALAGELFPDNVTVLFKDETMNPGRSAKARVARSMVDEATAAGKLAAGTEIVLPSSGGTAIAMAEETRHREVVLSIFLPRTTPEGKVAVLKQYPHVQVIKIDGSSEDARGAAASYVMAHEAERPMWYADQYSDESAPRIHMRETAPEIVAQTGASVTHVFVGMGTGSTATGLALVLRRLDVEVIGVQPAASRHRLAGLKYYPDLPVHLVPGNAHLDLLSATEYITDDDGLTMMHKLVDHGLRFGPSTGANLAAAVRTAARLAGRPAVFVLIAHDSFDLYAGDPTYEVTK